MADAPTPSGSTVGGNIDAAARGANAAIAQGGSAGLAAFQQGQAQLASAKAGAVNLAQQRAMQVGGPEASNPRFTAPMQAAYAGGLARLAGGATNLNTAMNGINQASNQYFQNMKTSAPKDIAAAQAAATAKLPQSVKEDNVIGAAQKDLAAAQAGDKQAADSYNKRITDAQTKADQAKQTMDESYQKWAASKSPQGGLQGNINQGGTILPITQASTPEQSKQLFAQAHQAELAYNQAQTALSQAKGVPAPAAKTSDVYTYAQQEATKNGYTPEEASTLFNSSNKTIADRIAAANPNVQQVDAQMQSDIRTGTIKYKDTFDQKISDLAKVDPYAADYLARKYEGQVTARPTVKSTKTAKVKGG